MGLPSPSVLRRGIPPALQPAAKRLYHRAMPESRRAAWLAGRFREQADLCERLGSPLYGRLLHGVADDFVARGPCWALVADRPLGGGAGPGGDEGLPMRVMGAVHRLILQGEAPELARHFPSAGGADDGDPWPAFARTVTAHAAAVRAGLERPVQTNEVSRCSALLGGFLLVARQTGLPLRLLEVASSAGLNLRWPSYRYEEQGLAWGDPASPVRLTGAIVAGRPPLDTPVLIASRRGCDLAPLDPSSPEDRLTLLSFVWPDELWRFTLLAAALELAAQTPVTVDRADACDWVGAQLRERAEGAATIVFHSIFAFYLDDAARARLARTIRAAGDAATPQAPLAWLRMEWHGPEVLVELTTWPGGAERVLARTDHRGRDTHWLAP